VESGRLIELYAGFEAKHEAGPYESYRNILRGVMSDFSAELDFVATEADLKALPDSVGRWPIFADTNESLKQLQRRFKLVILSNIDDDLFVETSRKLGVEFDDVITAQQVRSYKPAQANFRFALKRLGAPKEQILHVAQSLYHDHVPAKALGFKTVWVNRESTRPGSGVAPPADASPDFEVPDLESLAKSAAL
jgi:2-haloacid dehalogenase